VSVSYGRAVRAKYDKAHSKVTNIKQQKYVNHLKRPGYKYNTEFLTYFCCFIFVTLLWALHIVIKQQFFTLISK